MTSGLFTRKALVLSPCASHPLDFGNRNRVFRTTSYFKEAGYEVHFVLYPVEPDWQHGIPAEAQAIRDAWTSFVVVPPSRPLHSAAAAAHHTIDEWWDPQIGSYLQWTFARTRFDVFVANYTFLSKSFEFVPRCTTKVLEIHDVFSGRKEMFAKFGAPPEFFYTTPDQERIALDRADLIIAIKDAEANDLRRITKREIVAVPYYASRSAPAVARSERLLPGEELRVGFIGAKNSVNVINVQRFLDRYVKYERIYVPLTSINIAGNVCSELRTDSQNVKLLGRVESLDSFYEFVDVIVAPLEFSTGIKIKVGEALAYGKPIVATKNGFDGFLPFDKFHTLDDMAGVCRALMTLAFDRERLRQLETRSHTAGQLAARRSEDGYLQLTRALERHASFVVFVTDQQVWRNETFQQERLAQWCEFCSYFAHTIVLYVGPQKTHHSTRTYPQFEGIIDILHFTNSPELAIEAFEELAKSCNVVEAIISVGGDLAQAFWNAMSPLVPHLTLDMWVPELAGFVGDSPTAIHSDIWLSGEAATTDSRRGRLLSVPAFRYMPDRLASWKSRRMTSEVYVLDCDANFLDCLGLELFDTLTGPDLPINVLGAVKDGQELFSDLRLHGPPGKIVAVGEDLRAVEVCRCIARYSGAEFIHIASQTFPNVFTARDGTPRLCLSYGDIAAHLVETSGIQAPEIAPVGDVGWSTYWRLLAKRAADEEYPEG